MLHSEVALRWIDRVTEGHPAEVTEFRVTQKQIKKKGHPKVERAPRDYELDSAGISELQEATQSKETVRRTSPATATLRRRKKRRQAANPLAPPLPFREIAKQNTERPATCESPDDRFVVEGRICDEEEQW